MEMVKDRRNVLVIVGREAEPPVLVDALRPRAAGTGFTLLVPATPANRPTWSAGGGKDQLDEGADWADAMRRAERAAAELRGAGLEVVETIVGEADFAAAAGDVLHSRAIDDVVVLVDPEMAIATRPDLVVA
ncbi:MAG TPA: hypothetical protein VMF55_15125 [Solirubrobacterales bacterium]|nr:hypothetical protein [Solirubrobacterales bacterium]